MWFISHIFFRVASLALGQSYDCPSASDVTLRYMGKTEQKPTINVAHDSWDILWISSGWVDNKGRQTSKYSYLKVVGSRNEYVKGSHDCLKNKPLPLFWGGHFLKEPPRHQGSLPLDKREYKNRHYFGNCADVLISQDMFSCPVMWHIHSWWRKLMRTLSVLYRLMCREGLVRWIFHAEELEMENSVIFISVIHHG